MNTVRSLGIMTYKHARPIANDDTNDNGQYVCFEMVNVHLYVNALAIVKHYIQIHAVTGRRMRETIFELMFGELMLNSTTTATASAFIGTMEQ